MTAAFRGVTVCAIFRCLGENSNDISYAKHLGSQILQTEGNTANI